MDEDNRVWASSSEILSRLGVKARAAILGTNPRRRGRGKVLVVKEAAGRRMSDVEYGGNREFMHTGRMQELLRQVIKDGSGGQG